MVIMWDFDSQDEVSITSSAATIYKPKFEKFSKL